MIRRANGTGSIYKRKGNLRKPWVARITLSWDEDDKRISETLGHYAERAEAEQVLRDYFEGYLNDMSDIILKDLYTEWSETKFKHISHSTIDNYKAAWLHIKKLGHLRFRDIRVPHWQEIIDSLSMSRSSLHKIKTLAVSLSDYALQNDIVRTNYAKFIKLPKWTKKEKNIFTDAEIKKMFKCDYEWIDTVLIMIYTGLRIGELVALTKFQIDLDNKTLTTGSKTDAGDRVVPIHDKIFPFIKERYKGSHLLEEKDKPMTTNRYRQYYYVALEQAGVERKTPHACRHTFASILARKNVDTLSIQKLMGHTDYALTANVYSHPQIKQLRKAISRI